MIPWRLWANWPTFSLIWERGDYLLQPKNPQMAGFYSVVSGFHVSGAGWLGWQDSNFQMSLHGTGAQSL